MYCKKIANDVDAFYKLSEKIENLKNQNENVQQVKIENAKTGEGKIEKNKIKTEKAKELMKLKLDENVESKKDVEIKIKKTVNEIDEAGIDKSKIYNFKQTKTRENLKAPLKYLLKIQSKTKIVFLRKTFGKSKFEIKFKAFSKIFISKKIRIWKNSLKDFKFFEPG